MLRKQYVRSCRQTEESLQEPERGSSCFDLPYAAQESQLHAMMNTASTVLINSDGASYCSLRKASLSVPQERRSSQDSKNGYLPDSSQDDEVRLFFYRGICTNTPLGGQKARRTKPFPISPFWLSIHIHLSCIP